MTTKATGTAEQCVGLLIYTDGNNSFLTLCLAERFFFFYSANSGNCFARKYSISIEMVRLKVNLFKMRPSPIRGVPPKVRHCVTVLPFGAYDCAKVS